MTCKSKGALKTGSNQIKSILAFMEFLKLTEDATHVWNLFFTKVWYEGQVCMLLHLQSAILLNWILISIIEHFVSI